jgi:hypothetical protein
LSFLVYLASDQPGSEVWLPEVIRDESGSTLPTLMYGCRAIRWAWEARTHNRAQYVSNDRFKLFFQRIGIAEDCLERVIRREPDNVMAHALAGLNALSAEQFRIIGDQVTESPWSYFEDPGVRFCEIRQIVQRAVSR